MAQFHRTCASAAACAGPPASSSRLRLLAPQLSVQATGFDPTAMNGWIDANCSQVRGRDRALRALESTDGRMRCTQVSDLIP